MKKKYLKPSTETAPLFLSANIMSAQMPGGGGVGGTDIPLNG